MRLTPAERDDFISLAGKSGAQLDTICIGPGSAPTHQSHVIFPNELQEALTYLED